MPEILVLFPALWLGAANCGVSLERICQCSLQVYGQFLHGFCGGIIAQTFPWPSIESVLHHLDEFSTVLSNRVALGNELPDLAVGVLICSPFTRRVGVTEEDGGALDVV